MGLENAVEQLTELVRQSDDVRQVEVGDDTLFVHQGKVIAKHSSMGRQFANARAFAVAVNATYDRTEVRHRIVVAHDASNLETLFLATTKEWYGMQFEMSDAFEYHASQAESGHRDFLKACRLNPEVDIVFLNAVSSLTAKATSEAAHAHGRDKGVSEFLVEASNTQLPDSYVVRLQPYVGLDFVTDMRVMINVEHSGTSLVIQRRCQDVEIARVKQRAAAYLAQQIAETLDEYECECPVGW